MDNYNLRKDLQDSYDNKNYAKFEEINKIKQHWPINMFYPITGENENDDKFIEIVFKYDDNLDNFMKLVLNSKYNINDNNKLSKLFFMTLKKIKKLNLFIENIKNLTKNGPYDSGDNEYDILIDIVKSCECYLNK